MFLVSAIICFWLIHHSAYTDTETVFSFDFPGFKYKFQQEAEEEDHANFSWNV